MLDMYLLSYIFIPYLICFVKRISNTDQAPFAQLALYVYIYHVLRFLRAYNYILCTITIIVKIQYLFIPAWEHLKILSTARTTIILYWVEVIKLYVGRKIFPPRYSRDRPARTVDYLGDACCVALGFTKLLIFIRIETRWI